MKPQYAPFYLQFGRDPILPVDVMFGLRRDSDKKFVQKWSKGMQDAYELSSKNAKKSSEKGKRNYDKCLRSSILNEGDRVLVKNLSEGGGPGK